MQFHWYHISIVFWNVSYRDFPNGWAPIQHLIVEGLVSSGSKEAKSMAEDIAVRWIRTNYVAYKKTKAMVEKYDVEKCGELGGGGEYVTQVRIILGKSYLKTTKFGPSISLKLACNL